MIKKEIKCGVVGGVAGDAIKPERMREIIKKRVCVCVDEVD